ncbi:Putative exonuclease, RdgC [Malonomonas rubra DSM 5091]|uniref:Putative exonuclease, RdgC n=1 Tax=Malonomonas rubra DSM 5091 TaxID=1122189 RepID=A0A1M6E9V9_MALRU|nr:recombination-associated protein RdgC [Malonomonas rubra]SHI82266.1 Putative exonuclease, RdgC [Malonomonas rubra DSM 5091]
MGFLAASASVCYFQVVGDFSLREKLTDIQQQLNHEGFRSIEQSTDELSTGWVELDDYESSEFATEYQFRRDQHLCFTFRQDRRKAPAALLKRQVALLSHKFLAENPTYNRVPKGELEQIRDTARSLLFARTLPTPSCYDVIWDTEKKLLRLCSLSQKVIDAFLGLFHQTFPDLRLQLLHPLARAEKLLPQNLQEQLQQSNQAQTDAILEQIEANRWLGTEFLRWLFFRTLNSDSNYAVNCDGPLLTAQPFGAFLDNRVVLIGGSQEGIQKVVVAGPQDHYSEVRAALSQGKEIEEATLHFRLDNEDDGWKLTLKGERFQFGGFRTPMVKPESDPSDDPAAEAEAAFLTKLGAMEEGEQMFGSLLKSFLQLRLGESWATESSRIDSWLEE